jgi:hypothetical protein
MLADELGLSLGFILIGGQTNDCTQSIPLLGERRPRPRWRTKGYDPTRSSATSPNAASVPLSRRVPCARSNAI